MAFRVTRHNRNCDRANRLILEGVNESDAEHLQAFGITTVADLGTNKFFLWAQAVTKQAE